MSRARMLYEEYQDMTVFQMLQKNAGKFQERTMLSYWRDGQAVSVTHSGFLRDVQRLAAYFDRLGLRGRRIVIDGRNTYEQLEVSHEKNRRDGPKHTCRHVNGRSRRPAVLRFAV